MGVGYSGCCGSLLVFTGQVEGSEGCVCLMSEVGMATLLVRFLWSVGASDVVGVSYRGPLSVFLAPEGVSLMIFITL